MKTIFIIMHRTGIYPDESKPKIAFERREDAEVMLEIFKDTARGELTIVEVPLQAAPTGNFDAAKVSREPLRGIGIGAIGAAAAPNKADNGIKGLAPEPYPDAVMP